MIQRAKEDRRSSNKGRKSIGRRKNEKYSLYAYRSIIVLMFIIVTAHITLILLNL